MIIPGIPTQTTARFWVQAGSVAPIVSINPQAAGILTMNALTAGGKTIAYIVEYTGLKPNAEYTFTAGEESLTVCTLPDKLSETCCIATGSCYWKFGDTGGRLSKRYQEVAEKKDIRLRFLLGDQIYNDVFTGAGFGATSQMPKTLPNYKEQWQHKHFLDFLRLTPTAMLADDHEYWNDYPHDGIQLAWQWRNGSSRKRTVAQEAKNAFEVYQQSLNIGGKSSFDFTIDPLQFFVLDTRILRTRYDNKPPSCVDAPAVAQLVNWINTLKGPGVLMLGPSFIREPSSFWGNLLPNRFKSDIQLWDYEQFYNDVWDALLHASHDILILAGDIHYGRYGKVSFPLTMPNGTKTERTIYESTSSGLCLLTSALSKYGDGEHYTFKVGSGSANLEYRNLFHTQKGQEHFVTIEFSTNIDRSVNFSLNYIAVNQLQSATTTQLNTQPIVGVLR